MNLLGAPRTNGPLWLPKDPKGSVVLSAKVFSYDDGCGPNKPNQQTHTQLKSEEKKSSLLPPLIATAPV